VMCWLQRSLIIKHIMADTTALVPKIEAATTGHLSQNV
jgi:hypothetical protein